MQVKIRQAEKADIPFLGWAIFNAAHSHLAECPWDTIFGTADPETRGLLERISQTPSTHWCHISKFWVAEADGRPVAAMSGFVPTTEGSATLAKASLGIAATEFGQSEKRLARIGERLATALSGLPDDLPDIWGIENVAVLPDYRGKGLINFLFARVLHEGRQKGFKRAQIPWLIGNEREQQEWERNGFKILTRKTSPAFETLIGTPGTKLFARDL